VAAPASSGAPKKGMTSEEVNRLIVKHAKPGVKFTLEDVRGHPAVAVGLAARVGVVVDGESGDFLAAYNAGALVVAKASVGNYAGYGMTAGAVQVVGSAGEGAGAFLQGGTVQVFGDAGGGAAWRMAGGEVVVKGNAGELAGAGMSGGDLAVLGTASGPVGTGMSGGSLFVRKGTVVDGSSARVEALDAAGADRLKALAAAVKVSVLDPAQFVRVRAAAPAPPPGPAPPQGPRVRVESDAAGGPA
jgi:glutamate synthase domain-containing protein 3